MKADLHVHSRFSTRPSHWILQKLGCPESFTQPEEVYRVARSKGMDLVTITDHNTIDGVLEIAHLPGVFISEEVTTYFPEDRCKIHVLVYDISEKQHQDIGKIRENIYDLVTYLRDQGIIHAVAHPLYSLNGKLTTEHFEKMLLLFRIFELNGARNDFQNQVLQALLPHVNHQLLHDLADKHNRLTVPIDLSPKALIGGSDDHSSLNIARTWTQASRAQDMGSFLEELRHGQPHVAGTPATPLTMAHNLYGIAYQYYRDRFGLSRHLHKDLLLRFLERVLDIHHEGAFRSWSARVYDLARSARLWRRRDHHRQDLPSVKAFWKMSESLVAKDQRFMSIAQGTKAVSAATAEKLWYQFVEQVSESLLVEVSNRIGHQVLNANLFDIFGSLGSAGALYSLVAPYLVAFSHFRQDVALAKEVAHKLCPGTIPAQSGQETAVAHFSDTVFEVNGVARTLVQQLQVAQSLGHRLVLLTSEKVNRDPPVGVINFEPIGHYTLPEYPELSLNIPPLLKILRYCYEQNFTQIHAATPGPMGLAALVVARTLFLPIVATYHTAFPQYVQNLTNDEGLASLTWRFVIWYYQQMDHVYVPSAATAEELVAHGLSAEKISTYPRGVDIELFSPRKRSFYFRVKYKIGHRLAALYVGRLSKEKNLDLLIRAFKKWHEKYPNTALVVVGDGPYREAMEQALKGTHTVFTGYLFEEALAEAYASCDFLVFPSTTDTFGNVVLEAQASGLPVIVSDSGGPQENIIPGRTGWIFQGDDDESLFKRMEWMCLHREKRVAMGKEAKKAMEGRSFQRAFEGLWEMFSGSSAGEEIRFRKAV
ncbi:MAG: glycosyltransferase [Desulfosoma sp.]